MLTATVVRSLVVAALAAVTLASCLAPPPEPTLSPTATDIPAGAPLPVSTAQHRVIQVCLDRTASYDPTYFDRARELVAAGLEGLAGPDQGGVHIYISLITEQSYREGNTLMLIEIPAIPPDPLPPALAEFPPTATTAISADPRAKASATAERERVEATRDAWNQAAQDAYQEALTAQAERIAQAQATAAAAATELLSLNPPVAAEGDAGGSDILGCIQRGADRFAERPNDLHTLIIASDLDGTGYAQQVAPPYIGSPTPLPSTPTNIALGLALPGAKVSVIFFPSEEAGSAGGRHERIHHWTMLFAAAKTHDVAFSDPSSSTALALSDVLR